jgi:hypothetical protein
VCSTFAEQRIYGQEAAIAFYRDRCRIPLGERRYGAFNA